MAKSRDTELLNEIQAFLTETGMKPWEFGRKAINDPKLWAGLRKGRELRRSTRARVLAFLAKPLSEAKSA